RAVGGDQSLLRLRIVMAGPADGDAFVRVRPALPPRAEADGGHFDVRSSESDLPHRRRILTGLRGADVSSAHVGTTEKPANGAGRADETSAPLAFRRLAATVPRARPKRACAIQGGNPGRQQAAALRYTPSPHAKTRLLRSSPPLPSRPRHRHQRHAAAERSGDLAAADRVRIRERSLGRESRWRRRAPPDVASRRRVRPALLAGWV